LAWLWRLRDSTAVAALTCFSYIGARAKKTYNGVTTYYVGALYESTTWNGGSSISKFYYFGGQRVAVKQDINTSYIHSDHLGSTSKTTGASSSTQTYYPFGAIRTASGTLPTDYGFTGQKRDATANLMFYGARYYDPALARFIQPDTIVPNPIDPQSLNRYSYVRNNPVNRIDPSGHDDCEQQSEDCDTYFHAQGLCWNAKHEEYSKSCPATVDSEEHLDQLRDEHPELLANPHLQLLFGIDNQEKRLSILNTVGNYIIDHGGTDLDLLVTLSALDAQMVRNNPLFFVDDLTLIFLGWHARDAMICGINNNVCRPTSQFSLAQQINARQHRGSGFDIKYQDPLAPSNQPGHFWEFVAVSYWTDGPIASVGAIMHERVATWTGNLGGSDQDLALSFMAIDLGQMLAWENISPMESPLWLYAHLGPPYDEKATGFGY
jgi:RHS repeat-associated protein